MSAAWREALATRGERAISTITAALATMISTALVTVGVEVVAVGHVATARALGSRALTGIAAIFVAPRIGARISSTCLSLVG